MRGGLGEMAVVVLGILIAFSVDAGWDRYRAQVEERQILLDLQSDFHQSLDGLEARWQPIHQGAFAATLDATWRLRTGTEPPAGLDFSTMLSCCEGAFVTAAGNGEGYVTIPDSVVAVLLLGATYDPTLASLDALLQGGTLGKISNRQLRIALADFPARLADLADEERLAREHSITVLRPLMGRSVDLVTAEIAAYTWVEARDHIAPSLERRTQRVPRSQELENALATRIQLQNGVVVEVQGVASAMERILALLGEALGEADGR